MFENLIQKHLNADAQEAAATETVEATTATTTAPVYAGRQLLTMISTGALTNEMLLLTQKKKKKSIDKVYDNTFVQMNDGELIKGLLLA